MTYSIQRAVSDGSLIRIDVGISYLDREEISVLVGGTTSSAWQWHAMDNAIILDSAPAAGVEVMLVRTTSRGGLRHVYSAGAAFNAPTLDESLLQTLHIAQEALEQGLSGDYFQDINMHGYGITNVRPGVAPGDVATVAQLSAVGAVQNTVRYHNTKASVPAYPLEQRVVVLVDESRDGGPTEYVVTTAGLTYVRTLSGATVQLASMADLPASRAIPGDSVVVGDSTFKVVGVRPVSGAYPLLPTANGWAIPASIARRFGAVVGKGSAVSAADWASANSRSHQGMEFDNRAGTVLLSSLNNPAAPQTGKLIEYSLNPDGSLGSEIMRTGELPSGHTEYFSIVYDADGTRFVWVSDDSLALVRKIPLRAGATVADTVRVLDLSASVNDTTLNVFSYSPDSLGVWCRFSSRDQIAVCKYSDLDAGVFAPQRFLDVAEVASVWRLFPGQMLRHMGGVFVGVSGARADTTAGASVGWLDSTGDRHINLELGSVGSEVEGLSFRWDQHTAKMHTNLSVWYGSTGTIQLYDLTDSSAVMTPTQTHNPLTKEFYTSGGLNELPAMAGTTGTRSRSTVALAPAALHVGGDRKNQADVYNPSDLYIAQWNNGAGRYSATIRYRGITQFIDGLEDTTVGPGYRWMARAPNGAQREAMHLTRYGLHIGNNQLLSNTSARAALAVVNNTALAEVGVYSADPITTGAPSFIGASVGLTYATSYTDMFFGSYNMTTRARELWFRLNRTRWRPEGDNECSLGTGLNRMSVIFAGSGTINTSDERDKEQIRSLDERELAVGRKLKAAIKAWKFKDSVRAKGEGARIHVGWIAQEVQAIFASEGLDGFDYACLCYDKWDALDDHDTGEKRAAGDRYGVRETQLLAFIVAST